MAKIVKPQRLTKGPAKPIKTSTMKAAPTRAKAPPPTSAAPAKTAAPVSPTKGAPASVAPPAPAADPNARQASVGNRIARSIKPGDKAAQKASMQWFMSLVRGQLGADGRAKSSARRIPESAFSLKTGMPGIGQMFFFQYDAKWKDELPYWDRFPLVIPIDYYKDGFLGLNLHYLPPQLRAKLLDELLKYAKAYPSPKAFMKVSYHMLKAAGASKLFQPTVHRYLTSHIKTDLVKVDSESWERAANLPVQQFQKASSTAVWKDSKSKL